MTVDEVIEFFDGIAPAARALGLRSHTSIIAWRHRGYVPAARQAQIEQMTGGLLKADVPAWGRVGPRADPPADPE